MVAREGSFTRAAAHLGVTVPTLSLTISRLESRIGVRLLNRTTRSVAMTEAGNRMMQRLAPALSDLEAAVIDAQTVVKPSGKLRLNVSRIAAIHYLAPVLGGFIKAYPNITLDIVTDGKLIDIVADGFDAGIRLGEKVHQDMVATRLGGDLEMKVVASPSYLEQVVTPATPQDLYRHPCLTYRRPSDGSVYRWEFTRGKVSCEIAVQGPIVVDEPAMLTRLALDGAGIAYQFSHQVDEFIKQGRLVQLLAEWTPAFPGFYLYYPGRKQVTPPLRTLLDYLAMERLNGMTLP